MKWEEIIVIEFCSRGEIGFDFLRSMGRGWVGLCMEIKRKVKLNWFKEIFVI